MTHQSLPKPRLRDGVRRRPALLLLLFTGAACTGCGVPDSNHEGPGRRVQHLVLSPQEEAELGQKAYRQVLEEGGDRVLAPSRPEVKRVDAVMKRLIRASQIEPLQREINLHVQGYTFDWEVSVIQDRQVNAFSLPGGKMVVFTALLHVVRNDDQLAAVLGHEMAHALAHHANERVAWEQDGRVSFLRDKAYDRAQESEADHIGVFLMTFAGYNPEEAVAFWREMEQLDRGGHLPTILSDHPSDERRLHDLAQWAQWALAGKKAYDEGRVAPSRPQQR